ncbi:hypothetical protein PAXINDRAFT_16980 [Paxillus involutus ATCC 200175]|uniref:Uncharacterized protein n=1 Tax=Paxillus involutus ATCC 200175 TaxID=664439 RepID=A0A0C9TQB9_PAXIN|nr:hypothetical protein PAXINDRAFT_16980 [Paxillus involutus ATCC 200175]
MSKSFYGMLQVEPKKLKRHKVDLLSGASTSGSSEYSTKPIENLVEQEASNTTIRGTSLKVPAETGKKAQKSVTRTKAMLGPSAPTPIAAAEPPIDAPAPTTAPAPASAPPVPTPPIVTNEPTFLPNTKARGRKQTDVQFTTTDPPPARTPDDGHAQGSKLKWKGKGKVVNTTR